LLDGSNYNYQRFVLKKFFGNVNFSSIEEEVCLYRNNVLQFVQNDFFKLKGYKIVAELPSNRNAGSIPKKSSVQCDINKHFIIYTDALVFYENEKLEKIAILFSLDSYSGQTYYELFSSINTDSIWQEWHEYGKKNNLYKNKKIDANCGFLNIDEKITWDDVILPDRFIDVIKSNVLNIFSMRDLLQKNKISMKRGIIFSGKPGGGKTMLCKILTKEVNATVIYVLPSHIKQLCDIARICNMARELAPSLVIIEDIDFLTQDRESGNNWSVVELMNQMDGIEDFKDIITLATTNMVDDVEKAIKNRPGRFDRVIDIPLPDFETRVRMLNRFCMNFNIGDDVDFNNIAKEIDKATGAYIKDVCITAAFIAIQDGSVDKKGKVIISKKYFDESLKEIKDKDFSRFVEVTNSKKSMGFLGSSLDE
jgi:AAA+ superfamily predicted ATPase